MRVHKWSRGLAATVLIGLPACGGKDLAPAAIDGPPPAIEHDAHAHEGPHGGQIIELGKGTYHAELLHDEAAKSVEIYLLDTSARGAAPTTEDSVAINLVLAGMPQQFIVPAAPLPDDPTGQASHFKLAEPGLCDGLCAPGVKARLNVTIGGKPYSGTIEAHSDDHAEHKH